MHTVPEIILINMLLYWEYYRMGMQKNRCQSIWQQTAKKHLPAVHLWYGNGFAILRCDFPPLPKKWTSFHFYFLLIRLLLSKCCWKTFLRGTFQPIFKLNSCLIFIKYVSKNFFFYFCYKNKGLKTPFWKV